MQQGELDRKEVMDDVQRLLRGNLGLGIGGQPLDLDVVLLRVGPYPVEGRFAQGGQGLPEGQRVLDVSGTGRGSATGHVLGSRGVSGVNAWENVRAAPPDESPAKGDPRWVTGPAIKNRANVG